MRINNYLKKLLLDNSTTLHTESATTTKRDFLKIIRYAYDFQLRYNI